MKQYDLQPDNLTFPFISKAFANLSNLQYSKIIHTHVVKSPFLYDIFVGTAMVDMYIKCNQLDLALKLFDRMPIKDVASWNVMIIGVSQLGFMDRIVGLFVQMRLQDIKLDSITVIGLIQSSSNAKNVYCVQAVHCFGVRNGTYVDVSVGNTLISSYSKCDHLGSAEKVFNEISVDRRTVISWNSMIGGYSHLEKCIETIKLYLKMCWEGVRPDLSTILSLLSSIMHPEMLLQGQLVHCHGIKLGCDSNVSVVNTLISMYSKCAETDCARYLFNSMCERTCVSWTAMISGYAKKGDVNVAFALFHTMEETNDLVTMVALLSACGQTGSLGHGRLVNKYAISNGFQDSIMVCNALIDMYSKCGSMTEAGEIFRNMPERTIISWTSMIVGYALNGNFEEALSIFYHMIESGSKPNRITFLAVALTGEIFGKIHAFTVEDRSHPEELVIYEVLDGLALHFEGVGLEFYETCILD
ncbi:Pentatricopeptide repeat-containing protein [Thalictrum thalictroides]|uniref:Pentatricopeptide repeat-containing protein n=1 Tax=Thalictrum thalictroides TaxID=46969 RepID=A0A7J6VPW2_THATH|nr:Pentatricopeptide repeat-containing protein [Thalictrum thalictroides]